MDQSAVALVVGMASAATTSLGWIVLHYLTRKREIESREFIAQRENEGREAARAQADRTRRLEIRLEYHERQIQEFYAPLYSCIQLIWNVWLIADRFDKQILPQDNEIPIEDVRKKIGRTLGVRYYGPLHEEIRGVLKTKMFLIDGVDMPKSFSKYLMHSVMENVQYRIREEEGIDTSSVEGVTWPFDFPDDVKAGLDKAMRHYDEIIQELSKAPAAVRAAMSSAATGGRHA